MFSSNLFATPAAFYLVSDVSNIPFIHTSRLYPSYTNDSFRISYQRNVERATPCEIIRTPTRSGGFALCLGGIYIPVGCTIFYFRQRSDSAECDLFRVEAPSHWHALLSEICSNPVRWHGCSPLFVRNISSAAERLLLSLSRSRGSTPSCGAERVIQASTAAHFLPRSPNYFWCPVSPPTTMKEESRTPILQQRGGRRLIFLGIRSASRPVPRLKSRDVKHTVGART